MATKFFLILFIMLLPTNSIGAGLTFGPPGGQLDSDPILDLVPSQPQIRFTVFWVGGPINSVGYTIAWDTTELQLIFPTVVSTDNPFPVHTQTPVGQLSLQHRNDLDVSGDIRGPNRPGPFPLDELTFRVLSLINDGAPDFAITAGAFSIVAGGFTVIPPPFPDVEVQPTGVSQPSSLYLLIFGIIGVSLATLRPSLRRPATHPTDI